MMDVLPQCILLYIFSYLPFRFVRTVSLVCKRWLQIAYDKTLIKNAKQDEFQEVNVTETVDIFIQAMEWRPSLFQSIDLAGATMSWEAFCKIAHNCERLVVFKHG